MKHEELNLTVWKSIRLTNSFHRPGHIHASRVIKNINLFPGVPLYIIMHNYILRMGWRATYSLKTSFIRSLIARITLVNSNNLFHSSMSSVSIEYILSTFQNSENLLAIMSMVVHYFSRSN